MKNSADIARIFADPPTYINIEYIQVPIERSNINDEEVILQSILILSCWESISIPVNPRTMYFVFFYAYFGYRNIFVIHVLCPSGKGFIHPYPEVLGSIYTSDPLVITLFRAKKTMHKLIFEIIFFSVVLILTVAASF
jgi:hypothetical protein